MTSLLRNSCNCRASSSPQKLKFPGTPVSISIIDTHNCACKGSSFTEGDEYGLVDLSGRVYLYAYVEEYKTTEYDQCGDDELGDIVGCFIHKRFLLCGPLEAIRIAYIPFRSNSPPARRIFAYPFAKIRLREGYILIVT